MYFTQEQVDTIQLPIRWKRIKLEVLNTDFQTLATIEGNATGGSLQKDATSFVRRTGSVQMCVPNVASATAFLDYIDGVTININGKIWLDKNVKISVGIDNYTQPYGADPKTVWYSFGICLIDAPVRTFGATGYTMEFNVIDLAAKMNGDRSGQLAVTTTLFPRVQDYSVGFLSGYVEAPVSAIGTMTQDDKNIYIGSSSGQFVIYNKSSKSFYSVSLSDTGWGNSYMRALLSDNDNIYVGGDNGKFIVYNKESSTFGSLVAMPSGWGTSAIYALCYYGDYVYVGGNNGCFAVYNKSSGSFDSLIQMPNGWGTSSLESLVLDEINIYIGGGSGKFVVYNRSTSNFGSVLDSGVGETSISAMANDSQYVYCGGRGNGLFTKYNKASEQFGTVRQSPNDRGIKVMEIDGSSVYCGGAKLDTTIVPNFCIYNTNNNSFSDVDFSVPLPTSTNTGIYSMTQDTRYIYVGGTATEFCAFTKNITYTKTAEALASCIEELTEFKRYTIYPIPEKWATLPYDIKMEVGSTVYSALEQFLDILSGWQMYFDNEGVFTVEPIPSGANDIVYPLNLQLNTQDVNSVDFNNVRNQVIVYGRSHNIDFYPDSSTWIFQGELQLNFDSLDTNKIQVGSTIFGWSNGIYDSHGVIYGNYLRNISIVVGGTTLFSNAPIYWYDDETKSEVSNIENGVYVFRIKSATTQQIGDDITIDFTQPIELELLGRQQTQACIVNGNPESPYFIGKGYKTETHYGETGLQGWADVLDYQINVTLTDDWNLPQAGQMLLFYLPLTIDTNPTVVIFNHSDSATPVLSCSANLGGKPIGGDYSVWAFRYNGASFDLIGRCPYANTLVESGGAYDNIYADSLARERAEYDLFLHTNMQNTITLSCVPDYSLDVNYRIKYNPRVALPPDANLSDDFEDKYFITKTVTYPLGLDGSAQTINAIEIYDDYNYVGYAYDLPTGT